MVEDTDEQFSTLNSPDVLISSHGQKSEVVLVGQLMALPGACFLLSYQALQGKSICVLFLCTVAGPSHPPWSCLSRHMYM